MTDFWFTPDLTALRQSGTRFRREYAALEASARRLVGEMREIIPPHVRLPRGWMLHDCARHVVYLEKIVAHGEGCYSVRRVAARDGHGVETDYHSVRELALDVRGGWLREVAEWLGNEEMVNAGVGDVLAGLVAMEEKAREPG